MPAGDPWQDSAEVPEPPVIEVEPKVQTKLVELVVTARLTVPVNPPKGETAMDEVPVAPALVLRLVGVTTTVKSCTITVTLVELVVAPLAAFTVTV